MEPKLAELDVGDLVLDPENPRFFYLKLKGRGKVTEAELQEEIERDDTLPELVKTIRASGVKDPIWVREDGGKYVVIEGNRRTVVLRHLLKEGVRPTKDGVTYKTVKAFIIPKETSPTETLLQKARLQTGKKDWGAFNVAAVTYILRKQYLMELDDIAVEMQTSIQEIKERLSNYELFRDYVAATGDENPRRFAYFTDCPAKVVEWMEDSDANRNHYFEWINPKGSNHKLRSVATKGGLRDFAKIVDDAEALKLFTEDSSIAVEDALEIVKQNDIYKDMPFVKRLSPLAQSLFSLNDTQIEKLKQEPTIKASLTSLKKACDDVLTKLN